MSVAADTRRRRRRTPAGAAPNEPSTGRVRVAAYTRRSVEKEVVAFGSIEAQREAIANYVASQRERGWELLPEIYEDRNLSGATLERPALQRLLADAQAGKLEVVCVYKFDRVSRSLVDFMQLIRTFEQMGVMVVSITQQIDTSTHSGRLFMNILASFAEYEREQISERIRHKMAAARARGQWQGGRPPLGLDVRDKALVVNEPEASQVCEIFAIFQRTGSLVATVEELARRGLHNKSWIGKTGRACGGSPFDVNSLRTLLRNPLLAGRMHAGDEVVPAAHATVVAAEDFDAVQAALDEAQTGPRRHYRKSAALLTGLFRCARCKGAMVPHYSRKNGQQWHYYVCATQKRRGAAACPGTRVPLGAMEAGLVAQLRAIGSDAKLQAATLAAARAELHERAETATRDVRSLEAILRFRREELDRVVRAAGKGSDAQLGQVHDAETACEAAEESLRAARERLDQAAGLQIDAGALRAALETFDVWEMLFPAERQRVLRLLLAEVSYDPDTERVALRLLPGGIAELARQAEAAT